LEKLIARLYTRHQMKAANKPIKPPLISLRFIRAAYGQRWADQKQTQWASVERCAGDSPGMA
jgi:hypothetical protein